MPRVTHLRRRDLRRFLRSCTAPPPAPPGAAGDSASPIPGGRAPSRSPARPAPGRRVNERGGGDSDPGALDAIGQGSSGGSLPGKAPSRRLGVTPSSPAPGRQGQAARGIVRPRPDNPPGGGIPQNPEGPPVVLAGRSLFVNNKRPGHLGGKARRPELDGVTCIMVCPRKWKQALLASVWLLAAGCRAHTATETESQPQARGSRPGTRPAGARQRATARLPSKGAPAGASCRRHADCASGVCERVKADMGQCAELPCRPGERADHNEFYCTPEQKWARTRRPGGACRADHECWQPDCFMNPNCGLGPRKRAVCRAGRCRLVSVGGGRSCRPGFKKVLAPEEYMRDDKGRCMQSMAQRVLRTVCVPCGNGTCDPGESECNCPEDCAQGQKKEFRIKDLEVH